MGDLVWTESSPTCEHARRDHRALQFRLFKAVEHAVDTSAIPMDVDQAR